MPRYRLTEILPNEAANSAATKTIDIDLTKPISRMVVEFKATNNNSVPTAHGAKVITKIELVDGSEVIHSLSGIQSQALSANNMGEMPFAVNEYRNDVSNIQTFQLNFGRWLWDPILALDPTKFSNLQLKITHNKALGGSTPDAGNLRVFAFVFDENSPTPRGFLMSKEVFSYSLVSSAIQRVDLPRDFPYRGIMIQSLSGGKQPWEQYNKIKWSINHDQMVPINTLFVSDLLKLYAPKQRFVETLLGIATASAVDHFTSFAYDTYANITNLDAALTNNFIVQDFGGTVAVTGDSAEAFQLVLNGYSPHGSLLIPGGMPNDMDTWYDPRNAAAVTLDITGGSSVGSGSTAEIVLEQLRLY